MLFVQDSALVEEEKDVVPQSPAPSQVHETFTLEPQEGSNSGLGHNPSDSIDESDTNQNEIEDTTLKVGAENRRQFSKLAMFFFVFCYKINSQQRLYNANSMYMGMVKRALRQVLPNYSTCLAEAI